MCDLLLRYDYPSRKLYTGYAKSVYNYVFSTSLAGGACGSVAIKCGYYVILISRSKCTVVYINHACTKSAFL